MLQMIGLREAMACELASINSGKGGLMLHEHLKQSHTRATWASPGGLMAKRLRSALVVSGEAVRVRP